MFHLVRLIHKFFVSNFVRLRIGLSENTIDEILILFLF